jgi:hypothetical protein
MTDVRPRRTLEDAVRSTLHSLSDHELAKVRKLAEARTTQRDAGGGPYRLDGQSFKVLIPRYRLADLIRALDSR